MIIQKVLKNHIKFLTNVNDSLDTIHNSIQENKEVSRLLSDGFHRLNAKDRKTVAKVLLDEVSATTNCRHAEVVTLVEQLHYTSLVGTVSTTESDVYDLVYCIDIPTMITRMKHQHANVMAM
jgi:hypothetical protein